METNTRLARLPLTPIKGEGSVCSKASYGSLCTAEPVVRHFELVNLNSATPETVYSLSGVTAKKLLEAERKRLRLEKTKSACSVTPGRGSVSPFPALHKQGKKFFGAVAFDLENLRDAKGLRRRLSQEIEEELIFEDKKILLEARKLVRFVMKRGITEGERRPVKSKCTQGKWFLRKGRSQMLSLVLAFAGTNESSVGRLLRKVDSAVWEWGEEFENRRSFTRHLDKVVMNYGFANFENTHVGVAPGKVVVEEVTLGKEGLMRENKVSGVQIISRICDLEAIGKKQSSMSKLDTCDSLRVYKGDPKSPFPESNIASLGGNMEDFFISEPELRTPEKKCENLAPFRMFKNKNDKCRRLSNIPEISGIEHQKTVFEQDLEELDFFEFEVTREQEEKEPSTENFLCTDLSKKFEHCLFNHKQAHSAKKQIKNFNAERFLTFSSSAKKMLTRSPLIKRKNKDVMGKSNGPNNQKIFNENIVKNGNRRVVMGRASAVAAGGRMTSVGGSLAVNLNDPITQTQEGTKRVGGGFTERNRMYLARMVLLGIMVLMILVLIKLFLEMGGGEESVEMTRLRPSGHRSKYLLL